jgi:selenocysteine-specific elongation factor
MVADTGGMGMPSATLVSRAGVPVDDVAGTIAALERDGQVRVAGDRLVLSSIAAEFSTRLLTLVGEFHKAQPLVDGVPREEARSRLFARAHGNVFDLVLNELETKKQLVVRDRLALPGHRLALSPDEELARTSIEEAYRRGGLRPPDAATLAAEQRIAPQVVDRMTTLLLRQKRLQRIESLIFHAETLGELKREIQALKTSAADGRATVDVTTFKDRYGVSRKFAIPLLEWLDRERVTRRAGETRVVL